MRIPPVGAAIVAVLGLAGAAPLHAAPGEDPGVAQVNLMEVEGVEGTVAVIDGTADSKGDKFNVPNLSFFQPASVTLVAGRQGDEAKLRLGKFTWDESFMGGSTGSKAYHVDRFRTQGDLLITVTGNKPDTPYRLIVWQGPETPPALEPVLVPPSQAGSGWLKWAGIALAALLLLGGAFYLGRRRRVAA